MGEKKTKVDECANLLLPLVIMTPSRQGSSIPAWRDDDFFASNGPFFFLPAREPPDVHDRDATRVRVSRRVPQSFYNVCGKKIIRHNRSYAVYRG